MEGTFVSLFAGCGGLDKGAILACLSPLKAFEWDKQACEVYPLVTGHGGIEQADLTAFDLSQLPNSEVIIGGPPCQNFSKAGKREGKNGDRNLWPIAIQAVAIKYPQWFLFENVPGLVTDHSGYFNEILSAFSALGYKTEWRILNGADYGVPQTRRRVFIAGNRTGLPIVWPVPTHQKNAGWGLKRWVSWGETLRPWLDTKPEIGQLPAWILRKYPRRGFWETFPETGFFAGQQEHHEKQHRLINEPSFTIVASNHNRMRAMFEDQTIYKVDKRAKCLLQTLPYDPGLTDTAIGNAVPPLLAQALFSSRQDSQEAR